MKPPLWRRSTCRFGAPSAGEFTLATNQVDFALSRFDLVYTNRKGKKEETPLCIHRAPLSTHERMYRLPDRTFRGRVPGSGWRRFRRVIPITNDHNDYAARLAAGLQEQACALRLTSAPIA